MNIVASNGNSLDPRNEIMIDILCEVLGDDCSINVDDENGSWGNCTLGEFSDLLTEIENHFSGGEASPGFLLMGYRLIGGALGAW